MLRLAGDQVESLLDELLPVEVRELLADRRLLAPIEQAWEQTARDHGRPTIPMGSLARLMVIKQRTGWGYETLVREVSDSLPLRRSACCRLRRGCRTSPRCASWSASSDQRRSTS